MRVRVIVRGEVDTPVPERVAVVRPMQLTTKLVLLVLVERAGVKALVVELLLLERDGESLVRLLLLVLVLLLLAAPFAGAAASLSFSSPRAFFPAFSALLTTAAAAERLGARAVSSAREPATAEAPAADGGAWQLLRGQLPAAL